LLAVLAHKGCRGSEPDSNAAEHVNKGAFGGNASDNVFGGQRPPGVCVVGHGYITGFQR
jgi:hypothetical protein